MNDSYDFENEEFNFIDDELPPIKRIRDMNQTELLQRFKSFFKSSDRAMLQDCLFRIVNRSDGTGVLEILCPNDVVQHRLSRKSVKISNTIRTCWGHVKFFSICIKKDDEFSCKRFKYGGHLLEDT
ncbi:hypothetical protein [Rivularia sp. UHCC 0363]|uniref:hypothetical protein n=1 Tax=Rivularia sp. UHCC 0363 TaxID=3110244 RepID=UPI002B1F1AED|nr:hypothetical protein [Rivularia sp. UHCC 0363]MEA5597687.1 hypothetical protein [Rivularia sp. UHCC 0363]